MVEVKRRAPDFVGTRGLKREIVAGKLFHPLIFFPAILLEEIESCYAQFYKVPPPQCEPVD
jgi:hypothetical protein